MNHLTCSYLNIYNTVLLSFIIGVQLLFSQPYMVRDYKKIFSRVYDLGLLV